MLVSTSIGARVLVHTVSELIDSVQSCGFSFDNDFHLCDPSASGHRASVTSSSANYMFPMFTQVLICRPAQKWLRTDYLG